MLTDTEILAQMSQALSPGSLSQVLGRFLRVPEAWKELHNRESLDQIVLQDTDPHWHPHFLAARSLGLTDLQMGMNPMAEDVEKRLADLEEMGFDPKSDDSDLSDIALQAIWILRNETGPDANQKVLQKIHQSPPSWRSALACAWPHLIDQAGFIGQLLDPTDRGFISLVANTLMANHGEVEAAQLLHTTMPRVSSRLVLALQSAGEVELSRALASRSGPDQEMDLLEDSGPSSEILLRKAILNSSVGDFDQAHQALSKAWDSISTTASNIADHLAEVGRKSGDPVLEVEARRQAFEAEPTPIRRAELALSLIDRGDRDEALSILEVDPVTVEEKIANGLLLTRSGEKEPAARILKSALKEYCDGVGLDSTWQFRLLEAFSLLEIRPEAILAAEKWVETIPAAAEPRARLADLLLAGGDASRASESAHLALALDPDHKLARRTLATSLEKSGEVASAIPYWRSLSSENEADLPHLARCALRAGDLDLALETSKELLAADPSSIHGQVLMGQILAASRDFEGARSYLDNATIKAPLDSSTWIALAGCQEEAGDSQSALTTLQTGIQSAPESADLYYAHARLLRAKGRSSEALESTRKAADLVPEEARFQLELGDLLMELGHTDEAMPVLRNALASQPFNWEIRKNLALAYENRGELASARRLLNPLPPAAPAELLFQAGRVYVKSFGTEVDNPEQSGLGLLEAARSSGYDEPSLRFWLARGFECSGDLDRAFTSYQELLESMEDGDRALHLEAVLGLARTAISLDRPSQAIAALEKEKGTYPTSLDLLVLLSEAYISAGRFVDGQQTARYAVDLDPSAESPLQMLSLAAEKSGSWDEAIHAHRELTELHPDDPYIWLGLANLALRADRLETVREGLANAIWNGRRDTEVLKRSSKSLVEIDRLNSAQRLLLKAIKIEDNDVGLYEELANVSEKVNDHESTLLAWSKYAEIDPEDTRALIRAGQALWNLERREAAIELWEQTLAANPENHQIQARIAKALVEQGNFQRALNLYALALKKNPEDPVLAIEVGLATARYGSPEEAVGILQQAAALSPHEGAPLTALVECLMRSGQSRKALETLQGVWTLNDVPKRARAFEVILNVTTDDLPSAKIAFEKVLESNAQSSVDAIWFARSALSLGEFDQATSELEDWLSQHKDDTRVIMELIRITLRLNDIRWLYQIANAHQRAPSVHQDYLKRVRSLLAHLQSGGMPDTVIEAFKRWATISNQPDDFSDHFDLEFIPRFLRADLVIAVAIASLKADKPERAIRILTTNIGTRSEESLISVLHGLAHSELGSQIDARQNLLAATRNPVVRPLASYFLARSWLSEGRLPEAISFFNDALAAWPDQPDWHAELGRVYAKDSQLDAALPHLQNAIELSPDDHILLVALARTLKETDQLSESLRAYSKALSGESAPREVLLEGGEIALAVGVPKQAETWFVQASSMDPSDAGSLIGGARAAMDLGKNRLALERAKAAIKADPNDPDVLCGMGDILASSGKMEAALQTYDRALEVAGGKVEIQWARCKLLVQAGRAKEAIEQLNAEEEKWKDEPTYWTVLAEAFEAEKDLASAIDAATIAVRLLPRNAAERLRLGRLARKNGQLDRALDELKQGESISPSDPRLPLELGKVYEERRDTRRALESFKRALELSPYDAEPHLRAGLLLKAIKAYEEASTMFEKAVELLPRDPVALHQLAAVRALQFVHTRTPSPAVSA